MIEWAIYAIVGIAVITALALLLSLFVLGFMFGCFALASVYQTFARSETEKANKRVAHAVQRANTQWGEAKKVAERLQRQWGADIAAKHQPGPSPEMEEILSAGPQKQE